MTVAVWSLGVQLGETGAEPLSQREHMIQHRLRVEFADGGNGRSGHGRMSVERASRVDRAAGDCAEILHQVGAAAQRGNRVAVGHRLADSGKVGGDPRHRLVATQRVAKAGHDLVEDQHRVGAGAGRAQTIEELLMGQQHAHGVRDGLNDDSGDVAIGQRRVNRVGVVERQHDGRLGDRGNRSGGMGIELTEPFRRRNDVEDD